GIIKAEIIEKTQDEIKTLVACFDSGSATCDTQEKLTVLEKQIDNAMKKEYIEKIRAKAVSLTELQAKKMPFPAENIEFKVLKSEIIERNAAGA
ncbi:hypothetical protein, partial [Planococcus sp. CAU13]|uniref:hypothetical protein n=1 Tax=Planococcus sp. CAU13 TaxID=1541197 RepID=UPI000530015D